jgi:hypothetical protein
VPFVDCEKAIGVVVAHKPFDALIYQPGRAKRRGWLKEERQVIAILARGAANGLQRMDYDFIPWGGIGSELERTKQRLRPAVLRVKQYLGGITGHDDSVDVLRSMRMLYRSLNERLSAYLLEVLERDRLRPAARRHDGDYGHPPVSFHAFLSKDRFPPDNPAAI